MIKPLRAIKNIILNIHWPRRSLFLQNIKQDRPSFDKIFNLAWILLIGVTLGFSVLFLVHYLQSAITFKMMIDVFFLGLLTASRVLVLVVLASLIWVPLGIWVGLRPRLTAWVQPVAQFLAAFPANILFPIFVIMIVKYRLNPDIWLSPLLILGTQWYIFFNVIAGASVFPSDLEEAAILYEIRSWLWWRKVILPAIFPYYITGALTASGGAWNASIVAEVVHWGNTKLYAHGLGAYITKATDAGDFHQVVFGVAMMSLFVILINRLIWRRLYAYAMQYKHFTL